MGKLTLENFEQLDFSKIAQAVYSTLAQTDELKAELVFMEEQQMQELNRDSRGVDSVTDVLSFPMQNGVRGRTITAKEFVTDVEDGRLFIGSIVLCNQKIKQQAQELGHSEERERTYLIVHGLMHLFGYDHIDSKDKQEMREKEKLALALLGIKE